ATRRRRLRAALRRDRERPVELFRLAESIAGLADARFEAARVGGRVVGPAGSRRRLRAKPRAWRRRPPRHVLPRAARASSAPHRLQRLGIRIDRTLLAEKSVRPARAE